jgi:hypothetical protein
VAGRRSAARRVDDGRCRATAGANGLDENALRGDALQLDDARVRQLVAAELAEYPNAQRLDGEEVTIAGARVSVSLRETVHFSLLGIFMGGGRFVVRANATAEPREVP